MSAMDILGLCIVAVILLDALGCLFFAWWADREAQKQARERQLQQSIARIVHTSPRAAGMHSRRIS